MPEHVLLPIQKFKELVDYTKRVNDIITGFIKRKPKNEKPEEPEDPPKARKRKIEPNPKSEPVKKKSKGTITSNDTKSKITVADTTPPTPEQTDESTEESEPEDAF